MKTQKILISGMLLLTLLLGACAPAVEPVDLPAASRQREPAFVYSVAESEDQTLPVGADRRNFLPDYLQFQRILPGARPV